MLPKLLPAAMAFMSGDKVKQVTWADLLVSEYLSRLDDKDWLPGLVDSYPHLKALVDKVHALPAIKAWVAKRPQTGF
ncbi:unnamed protein product [Sphagnum balticum]